MRRIRPCRWSRGGHDRPMLLRRLPVAPMLAAFVAVPAHAAEPYLGRWAENPAWCAHKRGTAGLPNRITRRSIETFASSCRVLSVKRDGAVWRIRTICRDEGQADHEPRTRVTLVLRVDGDLLYLRDANGVQNLTRCKP